jgi:aspartyl protease family protein
MGITYVTARVRRTGARSGAQTVRFLVDSGAVYTVLPRAVWTALKLRPVRDADFTLADGSTISRGIAEATFEIGGVSATSPAVLGAAGDAPLLGAVTLETLGLMLNPLSRELTPMRLMLAPLRG